MAVIRLRSIQLVLIVCMTLAGVLALRTPAIAQGYVQTNLVSDIQGLAGTTDPLLKNPWGVSFGATSPIWVSDNGTGLSTLYSISGTTAAIVPINNGSGVAIPPPKGSTAPSLPTGQVFNGTSDFEVTPGNPAFFIFASLDGTISGWNPNVNANAVLPDHGMVDNSATGAVYTGLAMASVDGINFLYAANFGNKRIDIFDRNYNPPPFMTNPSKFFRDPGVPHNFAPFNIQNVGGNLAVTYADTQSNGGFGLGYVAIFSPDGTKLVMHLQHGWWMDSPWGVAVAPASFGQFANDILVGNFGMDSGWIAAFDPTSGRFMGLVNDQFGFPIINDGLWALIFGNGGKGGDPGTLYFTAGINGGKDGLLGAIKPAP